MGKRDAARCQGMVARVVEARRSRARRPRRGGRAAGAPSACSTPRRKRGLDLAGLDDDGAPRRGAWPARRALPRHPADPRSLTDWLRVAADPYLRREKPRDVLVAEVARARSRARPPLRSCGRAAPGPRRRAGPARRPRARARARHRGRPRARAARRRLLRRRDRVPRSRAARALRRRRATSTTTAVERDATLAVIGMGKLGGEELNFASDVDVIYVYSSDQGEAGDALAARVLREAVHAGHRRAVGGHRRRHRVPRRPAPAPRGRARARSRTRSRSSSATTRRSAGRGSARRGSRRARAPAIARSATR